MSELKPCPFCGGEAPDRQSDEARAEVERYREALREAERFMAYFAGETGGSFAGGGTPKKCLAQIRAALTPDG